MRRAGDFCFICSVRRCVIYSRVKRKMIDEDLMVSNFILELSNLSDMNPEFLWSHWTICILSGFY